MSRFVYLDHSATTPVDQRVVEAMLPFFSIDFGNPNSLHAWGRKARQAVDQARDEVSRLINAEPSEIIFTGGGSEADNIAIKGVAFAKKDKGRHIITSAIEHHAVLDTCKWLEKEGFDITILPVDEYGTIRPEELRKAIRPDTILVTIHFANNEIGTVQPIEQLGSICREQGVLFHTDAVQAAGHIPVDVKKLPIDLMTMAAHKMYGPKGVGALYIKKGVKIVPLIHGGGQERGWRSGTENTAGIVGFGKAAALASDRLAKDEPEKERNLRDRLIDGILEKIEDAMLTGHRKERLPFHASFCFRYIEGESLLLRLDALGIGASSGSACTSGSLEPSHVLLAIGLPHEIAHGSLRLTLGKDTSEEDIDYVLENLPKVVESLRAMSPYGKRG
ncbi:cysteine desulfurase [Acetomicrobium thermoterrenum DSM 13490]|uniref:Cysteine desulfurase IscS n=1 Tax=Acetomicrobium thermoterrenum DSM 13490 TaxID=1120987 RepID=A0A1H3E4Y6_9BACT|nr:cysteine desulfurase NifS [Acetomicrobium thermoterrenum]SDX72984.1 cysteine desulfurase [Acetomicrobium thermoterrenum DSM 13490]